MKYGVFRYLGITIMNMILFVRYVISPLYSSITNTYYHSGSIRTDDFTNTVSIALMILEMMSIFLVFHFGIRKLLPLRDKLSIYHKKKSGNTSVYNVAILIGVLSFLIFPGIRANTNFLIAKDFDGGNFNTIAGIGLIFTQISLQALLVVTAIRQFRRKLKREKVNKALILFVTLLQISVFWNTSRLNVLANGIIATSFLNHLKLISKTSINIIIALSVISVISITALTDVGQGSVGNFQGAVAGQYGNNNQQTNDYFQAYFGGSSLIATTIAIEPKVSNSLNVLTFLNEIASSILFVRQVFPASDNFTTTQFNYVFGYKGGNSMILPTLGQSYLYFGFWGSSLLSIAFSLLLLWGEKKVIQSKTIGEKYAFIVLLVWVAFFPMQNLNIISATFFNVFLTFFLLSKLNRKIKIQ